MQSSARRPPNRVDRPVDRVSGPPLNIGSYSVYYSARKLIGYLTSNQFGNAFDVHARGSLTFEVGALMLNAHGHNYIAVVPKSTPVRTECIIPTER